jgi:hypothetical protein
MLIAIPGLHYLQLHASPHTIGALLMLTALLLLSQRRAAGKVVPLAVILIIIIIFTHPTTPLLVIIFLAAALLTGIVYSRKISRVQAALAAILIVYFLGWFFWYSSHSLVGGGVGGIQQSVTSGGFDVGAGYISGTRFAYSDIYNLNKAIYFLYAAVGILAVLYLFARTYLEKRGVKKWIGELGGLSQNEAILAVSVLPLLLLSFLLAENAHDLLETGLTYIILSIAVIIASVILRSQLVSKKAAPYLVMIGVLFLTLSFPVVAYSIDAYSNFPRSEEAGLSFLAAEGDLEGKTATGWNLKQLALYWQPDTNQNYLVLLDSVNAQNLDKIKPDVVVFRNTGYYYAAMRNARSFEDNSYTRLLAAVESSGYVKVYSSPTFEVYLRDRLTATPP